MRKVFDHPVQGKDTANRLLRITQGSRSVAEYSVEFRIIAAESRWNDSSRQGFFLNRLSDIMKDELAARDETDTLDALISPSIKIDNHLRERRREKVGSPSSSPSVRPSPSTTNRAIPYRPPALRPPCSSSPPTQPGEEPMQLGRTHLAPAERLRRMIAGECLYCGQIGHFLTTCSLQPIGGAH